MNSCFEPLDIFVAFPSMHMFERSFFFCAGITEENDILAEATKGKQQTEHLHFNTAKKQIIYTLATIERQLYHNHNQQTGALHQCFSTWRPEDVWTLTPKRSAYISRGPRLRNSALGNH